jgi:hypothetical protein
MIHRKSLVIRGIAICALFAVAASSHAATIIKLNLGSVGPDVSMTGLGVFGTVSDGIAATTGDQNTDVEFTGFLDGPFPDITTTNASFTLSGLSAVGPASVFGTLVIQPFLGGTFNLYDTANVLLLSGPLTTSTLTGVIGPPGTAALFTTTLGTATGGTLLPLIAPGSVSLSLNMTNVNGGAGLSVGAVAPLLNPFSADASVNIAANPIPEPAALVLVLLSSGAAAAMFARRRSH